MQINRKKGGLPAWIGYISLFGSRFFYWFWFRIQEGSFLNLWRNQFYFIWLHCVTWVMETLRFLKYAASVSFLVSNRKRGWRGLDFNSSCWQIDNQKMLFKNPFQMKLLFCHKLSFWFKFRLSCWMEEC